jgi:hypothetical protein
MKDLKDYLYTEEDVQDTISGFKKLEYNAITKTEGIGFNGKFGMIFKPIKTKAMKKLIDYFTPTNEDDAYLGKGMLIMIGAILIIIYLAHI